MHYEDQKRFQSLAALVVLRSHNQSKGFAFITAPQYVTKELVKLNGVPFKGNCLTVEETKSRRKSNFRVDHARYQKLFRK